LVFGSQDGQRRIPAAQLDRLVSKAAPGLVARFGVGPDSAGALLVAAEDNPDRLRSEACFSICGRAAVLAPADP
jgi:transposase